MDSVCMGREGASTLAVCMSHGTAVTVPVGVRGPPLALSRGHGIGWIPQGPV